jgi:hypothetical protein
MSTIYRKSRRAFFKIEQNGPVTTVMNKFRHTVISITDDQVAWNDALQDNQTSTEEEFNTAYKEAMERIQSGRI